MRGGIRTAPAAARLCSSGRKRGRRRVPHIVRFLDDPLAVDARELGYEMAPSLHDALDLAVRRLYDLRRLHGPRVGYVIEDRQGRRLRVGP